MIYVLSDIHGNTRRFNSILSQIDLQPQDTLYILGDAIDRHPDGIRILRRIMAAPNMKMLLGNHEYMMLKALGEPYDEADKPEWYDRARSIAHWYRNGGEVTHRHWKRLRKGLRDEIIGYLKALPLAIDITVGEKVYKLVHGAPAEFFGNYGEPYKSPTHFSVWMRWQVEDRLPGGYTMVFGHTPTRHYQPNCPMEVWYGQDRIGIDCGSGYSESPDYAYRAYGRLACLRLDDGKEFYSLE